MITKAIVRSINKEQNRCIVRMPLFETAANMAPVEAEALVNITPGFFNNLFVGDVVFVGFEENALEKPIILGKLYKGTSFESNTLGGMGIVDKLLVRTEQSTPAETTYFRYSANKDVYKHFTTPKKMADYTLWLEGFTKTRFEQVAENFTCFKNWTQWQLQPENVEIDDGDLDNTDVAYKNKYKLGAFAYQAENENCEICVNTNCKKNKKRKYIKIVTDSEYPRY